MVDSEQHFLAACRTVTTERSFLQRSLRIEDHSVTLDAVSIFGLTAAAPRELDNHQAGHLRQICKSIHTMYDKKLRTLEELKTPDKDDDELLVLT